MNEDQPQDEHLENSQSDWNDSVPNLPEKESHLEDGNYSSDEEDEVNGEPSSPDGTPEDSLSNPADDSLTNGVQDMKLGPDEQESDRSLNEENTQVPVNKGERILIEKDGKFELIDATAVKAEFFDMLGINPEENGTIERSVEEEKPSNSQNAGSATAAEITEADMKGDDTGEFKRPNTSPVRSSKHPPKSKSQTPVGRSQSAAVRTRSNQEYNHVRSKYGMTEQQLEMKRRREEVLLRRKKEEEERRKEEVERKRQDAERAFQAWLHSKNSEALEKRRASSKDQGKDGAKEKEESAQRAYQAWLEEKAKQMKQEKILEKCRLEEEASSYVIRDRNLCEAAFQSWLRKKRQDTTKKTKRSKKKKSHGKDTQSSKPSSKRLSDYYGYKNTLST